MKKAWYQKYIGYCFYDSKSGHEVVLQDIYQYEDGRKLYQMLERMDDGTYKGYICDWKTFKDIAHGTALPK